MTALNTPSLNTLQAGNQFILDNLMTWEEAWAGCPTAKRTTGMLPEHIPHPGGAASDAGKVAPETKLGKAMLMFDAMMNLTEGFGRELTGGRLKKAVSTDSAFFIQHAAEHQTSGVRMLALMDSYRGKLKDKDGNVIKNTVKTPMSLTY